MKYKSPLPKNLFIKISLTLSLLLVGIVLISFYFFSYNLKDYILRNSKSKIESQLESSVLKIEKNGITDFCKLIKNQNNYRYTLFKSDKSIICDNSDKDYDSKEENKLVITDDTSETIFSSRFSLKSNEDVLYGAKVFYLNSNKMLIKISSSMISVEAILKGLVEKIFFKALPLILFVFFISYILVYYFSRSISKVFLKTLQIGKKLKFTPYDNTELGSITNILDNIDTSLESNIDNLKLEIKKNSILLQSISDGIFALDENKKILIQNIRFNRLFSYYKFSTENAHDFLGEEILSLYINCLETGEDQVIYNYSLNDRIIDIRVSAILNTQHKVKGAIGVFRDITKLQKTQKLKAEFITNISHELKTPLTSIKGYSELLAENSKTLEPMELKYINKILTNSNKLIDIYDNLLTLSSVEAKKEFKKEKFEFTSYLENIFTSLKTKYNKAEAELVINADIKSLTVNTELFKQVFYNLMENSFKYSNANLRIHLSCQIEDHNIIIKFIDNGIGIPQEKIQRVFERFYRTDESRSAEVKGSGIGLSIVKHIVEKHNGKIFVSSNDSGAVFTVTLPVT